MFNLIKQVIGYTQTTQSITNYDSYIIYISATCLLLLTVVFIDLIFKVFRAFIPRSWR